MIKTDIVIIGSGIGALSAASKLCRYNKKIIIITKALRKTCNSSLAQGGISVALSEEDNYKLHYEDTMEAGCYLNDSDAVMTLVKKAPDAINQLIDEGMEFDTDENGKLCFGREGAHRLSRVVHAGGDRTGLKVIEQLLREINDNVEINENEMALDLRVKDGVCGGVTTRDKDGRIKKYEADYTILATGGIGQLYPCTSNDITITGDGIAMAYRAGCRLKNLEFVQFHPTMLDIDGRAAGLVSEAVRGAGGVLVNDKGERFMKDFLPFKDLSPRDVVSREVYARYLKGEKIYLDISAVDNFRRRFPSITEICESNGVNVDKKLIPIMPGAHFHMGGIEANAQGDTNINGLYAVGEVSCTGVHGANRLASNSLLEGIVFGRLLADNILNSDRKAVGFDEETSEAELKKMPSKKEIQDKMMEFVGIVRYQNRIDEAVKWFEQFSDENNIFGKVDLNKTSNEDLEIYNMLTAGWLIAKAAGQRSESVGAHYIVKR